MLDRDLARLFELLDHEKAAVSLDHPCGLGVLMARDNEEASGVGADGLVFGNCGLKEVHAALPPALADEPESLRRFIPVGEAAADLFDPLVHLAEESLVTGAPFLHRFPDSAEARILLDRPRKREFVSLARLQGIARG